MHEHLKCEKKSLKKGGHYIYNYISIVGTNELIRLVVFELETVHSIAIKPYDHLNLIDEFKFTIIWFVQCFSICIIRKRSIIYALVATSLYKKIATQIRDILINIFMSKPKHAVSAQM